MTDDQIRSAWVSLHGSLPPAWAYEFARQIEQASHRAALDECAKVCEEVAKSRNVIEMAIGAKLCAAFIRALAGTET